MERRLARTAGIACFKALHWYYENQRVRRLARTVGIAVYFALMTFDRDWSARVHWDCPECGFLDDSV